MENLVQKKKNAQDNGNSHVVTWLRVSRSLVALLLVFSAKSHTREPIFRGEHGRANDAIDDNDDDDDDDDGGAKHQEEAAREKGIEK